MTHILDKLKAPAIGLMVCGILSGMMGALTLLSGIMRFSGLMGKETLPVNEAERMGYYIGTFGGYGVGFISLIVSPLIIFGAMRMMNGRSRGLAITAAVFSILPVTSCCFFIGSIFGIWALIVLMNPEVKAFFQNGVSQIEYPPQPPRNW